MLSALGWDCRALQFASAADVGFFSFDFSFSFFSFFSPSVLILVFAPGVLLKVLCSFGICLLEWFLPLQQLLNPNRPCSRASQAFLAGRSSWKEKSSSVRRSDGSRCQPGKTVALVDGKERAS